MLILALTSQVQQAHPKQFIDKGRSALPHYLLDGEITGESGDVGRFAAWQQSSPTGQRQLVYHHEHGRNAETLASRQH
ncbi:hypothetical protein OK016_23705 [Vibrio chagasii]|nr:hypothetical protein [Vibrio chagasii]